MKVLVTGGAGFIGSNFVQWVGEHRPSWQITVLDNLSYAGNFENIASCVESGRVRFVVGDICDKEAVTRLFQETSFDYVFHFAAESHVDRSILGAAPFVMTNVVGTEVLLSAARQHGAGRFIHISTDEVYGSLGETGAFTEETPLAPSSPYSASKAGSDLLALAFAHTYGQDVIVTRCTNNYGPYQFPEKFIPLFVTHALEERSLPLYGDGMNVRSWIHVSDHCRAVAMIAEGGRSGAVYNIGGGAEFEKPNKEVALLILEQLGKPASLLTLVADRPGHDRRYAVDSSLLRSELGWAPLVPFEKGISETIAWYRENRGWWERIVSGAYRDYYEQNYGSREDDLVKHRSITA
jgi:dTDP-glucose 4,6-dehydratase